MRHQLHLSSNPVYLCDQDLGVLNTIDTQNFADHASMARHGEHICITVLLPQLVVQPLQHL